ncbi:MAG: hypothetical protein IT168_06900 [Bryobacterales bacterium]|nr:hypothetical protein [Bryobacterales bacterium]
MQPAERLYGWKEIGNYLGRDQRTVQLWEKKRGLPVHRVEGEKSVVWADPNELESWLRNGSPRTRPTENGSPPKEPVSGRLRKFRYLGWLTALAMLVSIAAVLFVRRRPAPVKPNLPPDRIFAIAMMDATSTRAVGVADAGGVPVMSPDGRHLTLSSSRNALYVIDLDMFDHANEVATDGVPHAIVSARRTNTVYFATTRGELFSFDPRSQRVARLITGLPGSVESLALTPDDATLFISTGRGGLHRYDFDLRSLQPIKGIYCPAYLETDPSGRYLFVSQRCGSGGKPGRDAIEVLNFPDLSLAARFTGQPYVGGLMRYDSASERLWADGYDACNHYEINRESCPVYPGTVSHIYDLAGRKWLRALGYSRLNPGGAPVFIGNLAIMSGNPVRVLHATTFALRESLALDENGTGTPVVDSLRQRLYLPYPTVNKVVAVPLPSRACSPPGAGLVHHWAFDGSFSDLIRDTHFSADSGAPFASGAVGRAADLHSAQLRAEAEHDVSSPQTTWAAWIRWDGDKPGRIIEVRKGGYRWELAVLASGQIQFEQAGSQPVTTTRSIAPATWTHVALRRNLARVELLINSHQAAAAQVTTYSDVEHNQLTIGPFPGLLDEVVQYERPIEDDMIDALSAQPRCTIATAKR